MGFGNGKGKNKNGGFTMVEMLAVAAIIVILLALGFAEVARHSRVLRVTEMDNMAREIYLAAENRAVLLAKSGRLENTLKGVPGSTGVGTKIDTATTRAAVDINKQWYIKYPADNLKDLIPIEVIDSKLRDGSFYIVYDIDANCVTDVFYDEGNEEAFVKAFGDSDYGAATTDKFSGFYDKWLSLTSDMRSRKTRADKKIYIGYYGGETVEAGEGLQEKPAAPVITIVNGEELTLAVNCEFKTGSDWKLKVTLTYDGYPDNPVNLIDGAGMGGVTSSGNTGGNTTENRAWTLDTLKPSSSFVEYKKQFKDWFVAPADVPTSFGKNFTINAWMENGAGEKVAAVGKEANSLFADTDGDTEKAFISKLRHLQNLDKTFSGVDGKTSAVQIEDIDAKDANSDKIDSTTGKPVSLIVDYKFKPIQNSGLKSYTAFPKKDAAGNPIKDDAGNFIYCTLSNLTTDGDEILTGTKPGAGLFAEAEGASETDKFKFMNVRLINASIDGGTKPAGGLTGTAENADFKNCRVYWVKTPNPADASAAEDYYALKNGTDVNYKILGTNAGGLVGMFTGGKNKITDSLAATTVKGTDNAGGLIGSAAGEVEIGKSYADCYLSGGGAASGTTGGLIGLSAPGSSVTLENVYAAGFAENAAKGGGLCAAGSVVSAKNAYAAVYYYERTAANAVASVKALADGVTLTDTDSNRCYYLRYKGCNWESGTPAVTTYSVMSGADFITKMNVGNTAEAFDKKTASDTGNKNSSPYGLKDNTGLADYVFPGLVGMPHYGDWKVDTDPIPELEIINGDELLIRVSSNVDYASGPTLELTYEDKDAPDAPDVTNKIVSIPATDSVKSDYTDASGATVYTWIWTLDTLKEGGKKFKGLGWQKQNETGALVDAPLSTPGRDFNARAKFGAGTTDDEWSTIDKDNSLFAYKDADAGETFDSNDDTARIRNLRHLQNLDKEISGVAQKTAALQIANIETASTLNEYKWDDTEKKWKWLPSSVEYAFFPIVNSDLESYTSTKPMATPETPAPDFFYIKNLKVKDDVAGKSASGKPGAGLFAEVASAVAEGETPAKIFTFANVWLKNATITVGNMNTGGLLGKAGTPATPETPGTPAQLASVKFTGCRIEDGSVKTSGLGYTTGSSAIAGIGGMAGFVTGDIEMSDCRIDSTISTIDNPTVQNTDSDGKRYYAGGLVGNVQDGNRIIFKNCSIGKVGGKVYVKGTTDYTGTTDTASFIGGLAGRMAGTSVSVDGCEIVNAEIEGSGLRAIVGGLAGYAEKAAFKNDLVGGIKNDQGNIEARGTVTVKANSKSVSMGSSLQAGVGGMVGYAYESISMEECKLLGASVTGMGAVDQAGGLIGHAQNMTSMRLTSCIVGNESGANCETVKIGTESTKVTEQSSSEESINNHTGKGMAYAGGLVGRVGTLGSDISLTGCKTVKTTVKSARGHVGGMVGYSYPNISLSGCTADRIKVWKEITASDRTASTVEVSGFTGVGGLLGYAHGNATLNSCNIIDGDGDKTEVAGRGFRNYIGGLVGYAQIANLSGCEVIGKDGDPNKISVTGAFAPDGGESGIPDHTIFVGGMVGGARGNNIFTNCQAANIKVDGAGIRDVVGGIVGLGEDASFARCTVQKASVTGNSTSTTALENGDGDTGGIGGIMGYSNESVTFKGCNVSDTEVGKENTSNDFERNNAGGMAGYIRKSATFANDDTDTNDIRHNKVEGVTVFGTKYAGGMVGVVVDADVNAMFANCEVLSSAVTSSSPETGAAGGIVGCMETSSTARKLASCTVNNNTTVTAKVTAGMTVAGGDNNPAANAGGLVGLAKSAIELDGCTAAGVTVETISQYANDTVQYINNNPSAAGGLAGKIMKGTDTNQSNKITNCTARNITVKSRTLKSSTNSYGPAGHAGGMVGNADDVDFSSCKVYWDNAGIMELKRLKNPTNPELVTALDAQIIGRYAGGLAGRITKRSTIASSLAATFVNGSYSGGLIGVADNGSNVAISGSYANNVLEGYIMGGLIGNNKTGSTVTLTNVYASGNAGTYTNKFDVPITGTNMGWLCGDGGTNVAIGHTQGRGTLKVTNAYSAIQNNGAAIVAQTGDEFSNCFYIDSGKWYLANINGIGTQTAKANVKTALVDTAKTFKVLSSAETKPYLRNQPNSAYPYLGLVGLPHYGDWLEPNDDTRMIEQTPTTPTTP